MNEDDDNDGPEDVSAKPLLERLLTRKLKRGEKPPIGSLNLRMLVALPSSELLARDKKVQREQRVRMVRRWLSWGLPDAQVLRLSISNFKCTNRVVRNMIAELRTRFVAEAKQFEMIPVHIRRHADRLRLQEVFALAIEKGAPGPAQSAAMNLIRLNGTMPTADEEHGFISDEQQAARGVPMERLLELVAQGDSIEVFIPGSDDEDDE